MTSTLDHVIIAGGPVVPPVRRKFRITTIGNAAAVIPYHRLRRDVFVEEQGLFTGTDRDDYDDDPRTVVLLACSTETPDTGAQDAGEEGRAGASTGIGIGRVLGGVRIHPMTGDRGARPDLGWWRGSRLAVARDARQERHRHRAHQGGLRGGRVPRRDPLRRHRAGR